MKLKFLVAFLVIALALVLVLTGCGSNTQTSGIETTQNTEQTTLEETVETTQQTTEEETTAEETTEEETTESIYKKGAVDYNSLSYEHIPAEYWSNVKTSAEEKIQQGDMAEVYDALCKADDAMEHIRAMYQLIEIETYRDTTNDEYTDEYDYINGYYSDAKTEYFKLYFDVFMDERFEDKLIDYYTEEDIEYIKELYKDYGDNYEQIFQIDNQISDLENQYMSMGSTFKATIKGKELTVDEIYDEFSPLTYANYDRYKAAILSYYNQFAKAASDIYAQMIALYKTRAELSGYDDVLEFLDNNYSRDYGKEDVEKFYEYVLNYIVPLKENLEKSMTASDKAYSDFGVTDAVKKNIAFCEEYFKEVSPDMFEAYEYMNQYHLIDRSTSSNRASASFTTFFDEYDIPFIFIKEYGKLRDLFTYIHEFGHFYSYYVSDSTGSNNLDIAEIASQTSELLFMEKYLQKMYPSATKSLIKNQLLDHLSTIIDAAIQDEFQRRAFALEEVTHENLYNIYEEVATKYHYSLGDDEGWINLGDYWALYSHTFSAPLYYISYGMSLMPCLQIYEIATTDRARAIEIYNKIIIRTDDEEFLKKLEESGLTTPFEEETYLGIVSVVEKLYK